MKTLQQHIDEVMDYFDFEKVHKYMESINWEWATCEGVPDIPLLRQTVRREMIELYNKYSNKIGINSFESGGIYIQYTRGQDDDGFYDNFEVKFILDSWYTGE